jgi:hypothetical protein
MSTFLTGWTTQTVDGLGAVNVSALAVAYPAAARTQVDDSNPGSGRFPLQVTDAPTLAALATDYRFPAVRSGDDPTSFGGYQNAMLDACGLYQAAQLAQGFVFDGTTYPLDADARQDWHVVLTLGSALSWPKLVTSLDGLTVASMDQPTATAAAQAALTAAATAIQQAASYRQAVLAATTAAALDAITLT